MIKPLLNYLSAPFARKAWYFLAAMNMVMMATVSSYAGDRPKTLLIWGDSLSAAYGIPVEKGWVSLLQRRLGDAVQVVNGSISGETTQGGLTRLPAALHRHLPDYVFIELGANDGLRGIQIEAMRANLEQMIDKAQLASAEVILAGMKIPPNYGLKYTKSFEKTFVDLAESHGLAFVPFLLEGVADNFDLVQADGLHPTAEAQPLILDNVYPVLEQAFNNSKEEPEKATGVGDAATQTKL